MTAPRSKKDQARYKKHIKTVDRSKCEFCAMKKGNPQFIKETDSFKVLRNDFSYTLWDNQPVEDHLMLVPKSHTESLAKMTAAQKVEFVDLIESYESQGYNFWGRAPGSTLKKSVAHQHTHLIKPKHKLIKFVVYHRKSNFRITF